MHKTLEDDLEDEYLDEYIPPVVIRTAPALKMNNVQFYKFCRQNSDLRIERNARGDIIMAPTGGWTGNGNAYLTTVFYTWAVADGTGKVFDSDTGFRLAKKTVRAPDVSWVFNTRLEELPRKAGKRFLPLCPDFVLELRSSTDQMPNLHDKMAEYIHHGARLGWLINPARKEVFVCQPGSPTEHFDHPASLSRAEPFYPASRWSWPHSSALWTEINPGCVLLLYDGACPPRNGGAFPA